MNYQLNKPKIGHNASTIKAVKKFLPLLIDEKKNLIIAFIALLVNSLSNLIAPFLIGYTIDTYIQTKQYRGVFIFSAILLFVYIIGLIAATVQTKTIGGVAQRLLYNLRQQIFAKLQQLPVAFFNQNKVGDLISRINNDTDKLNQFFTQALMQFIGNLFVMTGAAIFILILDYRLGLAALAPAALLLILTRVITPWIRNKNLTNLKTVGSLSSEIQESLNNFKVIVAFNRRDYFRQRFEQVNTTNYQSALSAGIANNLFTPVYGLAANIAQIIVLFYGIYLITIGNLTVGILISYLAYTSRFYDPIRQIANLWSNFQTALAGWDRITEITALESDMPLIKSGPSDQSSSVLKFENISFRYDDSQNDVLHQISFNLEKGKTYALVGPTGGGKTTTAYLMARLYDPTSGNVYLNGRDIRSFSDDERTQKIGFILQDPFLFTGNLQENVLYGNKDFASLTKTELLAKFHQLELDSLLNRFPLGLDTPISNTGDIISLGQRQIVAFIRAILRSPQLLILDEATANIDTVTESVLDEIISRLPPSTTKVIIAHRLNTIENADEIYFVNSGKVIRAGSFDHAMTLLLNGHRQS